MEYYRYKGFDKQLNLYSVNGKTYFTISREEGYRMTKNDANSVELQQQRYLVFREVSKLDDVSD